MIKYIVLIILGFIIYEASNSDVEVIDPLIHISEQGYTDTFTNLTEITQQHLTVFGNYQASDFLNNDDKLVRDLKNLPIIKDVLEPLSEKLIELKECTHQDCSRELDSYNIWIKNEISLCDEAQATNNMKCQTLRHIKTTLLDSQ